MNLFLFQLTHVSQYLYVYHEMVSLLCSLINSTKYMIYSLNTILCIIYTVFFNFLFLCLFLCYHHHRMWLRMIVLTNYTQKVVLLNCFWCFYYWLWGILANLMTYIFFFWLEVTTPNIFANMVVNKPICQTNRGHFLIPVQWIYFVFTEHKHL